MARPTKLTPELLQKAYAYEYVTDGNKPEWTITDQIPTIEGFALYLGVNRDTIYDWSSKEKEFSDIVDDIKAEQASTLINKGLKGDFNSSIAKLMLSKHGYTEKTETDITTKGEAITPIGSETIAKFSEFLKEQTKE